MYPTKIHRVAAEDPNDSAIIDCAVEEKADAIVSGDGHHSELKQIQEIPVLSPSDYAVD